MSRGSQVKLVHITHAQSPELPGSDALPSGHRLRRPYEHDGNDERSYLEYEALVARYAGQQTEADKIADEEATRRSIERRQQTVGHAVVAAVKRSLWPRNPGPKRVA